MILVVSATKQETDFVRTGSGLDLLVSGIGPVEAAARVAQALSQRAYSLVVNAGIAGAYDPDLRIGEGVVVCEELFELNLETGVPIAPPQGCEVREHAVSDAHSVEALVIAGYRSVRAATVARVTATDESAARMRARGAQLESMEGFAVLRAAEIAGVRAVEVRGISNYARERTRSQWDFAAGKHGLSDILTALLALQEAAS